MRRLARVREMSYGSGLVGFDVILCWRSTDRPTSVRNEVGLCLEVLSKCFDFWFVDQGRTRTFLDRSQGRTRGSFRGEIVGGMVGDFLLDLARSSLRFSIGMVVMLMVRVCGGGLEQIHARRMRSFLNFVVSCLGRRYLGVILRRPVGWQVIFLNGFGVGRSAERRSPCCGPSWHATVRMLMARI